MMKTTQKAIRRYLNEIDTVDCTDWSLDDYEAACRKEGYLEVFARSYGTYGCNGLVAQGRRTGFLYVVPSRSSSLFYFSW